MTALRVGLLVILGALALAPAAGAATITPDIVTDEFEANDDCSLREAVFLANGDQAGGFNGCVAADEDADTIVLQAGATYELSLPGEGDNLNLTGDLDVRNEELTIESSGAGKATIDGGDDPANIGRVLELGPSPDFVPAVTLNRLTITRGDQDQGGGLWASTVGSVTINESSITDNDGSAGAGMRVNTPMTINDSTISGNSSASGGLGAGIWVETGVLALNGSSVSGNVTGGDGGGMAVQNGVATVTNSTFASNFAAGNGGNIWSNLTLNLRSSTIANGQADTDNLGGNGGGGLFVNGGTTNARNTVLGNNVDVSSGAHDCSGNLTSEGYNLIDQSAGCTILGDTTTNILDTDPQLGAFGANGGPTPTYAHPAGGPLENAANPENPLGPDPLACPVTDQRGQPRSISASRCDIGAYERQAPVLDPIGDRTVQAGQTLSFTMTATDVDAADTLEFDATNLPAGATIEDSGAFSWTPTEAQVGSHPDVHAVVLDGSLADTEDFTITVTAIPPPGGGDTGTTKPKKCKKKKAKKRASTAKKKKKCKKKKKRK